MCLFSCAGGAGGCSDRWSWSSMCCKPVSPSCSITGCGALAAPRQQRAGPLEIKTGISVSGSRDVPAGSLEKTP